MCETDVLPVAQHATTPIRELRRRGMECSGGGDSKTLGNPTAAIAAIQVLLLRLLSAVTERRTKRPRSADCTLPLCNDDERVDARLAVALSVAAASTSACLREHRLCIRDQCENLVLVCRHVSESLPQEHIDSQSIYVLRLISNSTARLTSLFDSSVADDNTRCFVHRNSCEEDAAVLQTALLVMQRHEPSRLATVSVHYVASSNATVCHVTPVRTPRPPPPPPVTRLLEPVHRETADCDGRVSPASPLRLPPPALVSAHSLSATRTLRLETSADALSTPLVCPQPVRRSIDAIVAISPETSPSPPPPPPPPPPTPHVNAVGP